MQQRGPNRIQVTYTDGIRTLHRLVSGNWVWDGDDSMNAVEDVAEVSTFTPDVQQAVQSWLADGGSHRAEREKRDILMAQQAEKQGTIDAMIDQLHDPELKGQIISMLKDLLQNGEQKRDEREVVATTEHGDIKVNADGSREFVPKDEELLAIIEREQGYSPEVTEEPEMDLAPVGVGADSSEPSDSIHQDIERMKSSTRNTGRGVKGKGIRKR